MKIGIILQNISRESGIVLLFFVSYFMTCKIRRISRQNMTLDVKNLRIISIGANPCGYPHENLTGQPQGRPYIPSSDQFEYYCSVFCNICKILEKSKVPAPALLCSEYRLRAISPSGIEACAFSAVSVARPKSLSIKSTPKPPL